MDTTQDIIYRSFVLNDADIADSTDGGGFAGTGIEGCVVDNVDMSDVDVVQWQEKSSQRDGNDAGDVFQGARRIRMAGTLYAKTRTVLFDRLADLRAALNPVLAQREEPLERGYQPLYFSWPTNRIDDYASGAIELQVKALPRSFSAQFGRDSHGGDDDDALAIPWQASFVCKDPGIYSADPVEVDFDTFPSAVTSGVTGSNATDVITKATHGLAVNDRITFFAKTGGSGVTLGTAYYVKTVPNANTFTLSATLGGSTLDLGSDITAASYVKSVTFSGTWTNRGTYLGLFNMLAVVGAGGGSISATVGDSVFTITVPSSTVNRTIRVRSDRVVSFEESSVETLQMSAIAFTGENDYPLIVAGDTAYSITFHGMAGLVAGGRMWFYEQYA